MGLPGSDGGLDQELVVNVPLGVASSHSLNVVPTRKDTLQPQKNIIVSETK